MASILLVEDRSNMRDLFADLISDHLPSNSEFKIDSCGFRELDGVLNNPLHNIYIFNITSESSKYYHVVKDLTEKGFFESKKIVICNEIRLPEITSPGNVDIHYCQEHKFTEECIQKIIPKITESIT